jgi:hypothetical protein
MTIQIGRYSVLINPFRRGTLRSTTPEATRAAESSLDKLADILKGNFEWVLSGGLAIPTTIGSFYRIHDDIDIGIHERDLGKLAEAAAQNGYGLFSRIFMTKVSPSHKVDVYKSVSPEEALEKQSKRLRLVRLGKNGKIVRHENLLDYFDVYTHYYEDGELVSNEDGTRVPLFNNYGRAYTTISKKKIIVRALEYIEQLKLTGKDEKDKHDLRILRMSGFVDSQEQEQDKPDPFAMAG